MGAAYRRGSRLAIVRVRAARRWGSVGAVVTGRPPRGVLAVLSCRSMEMALAQASRVPRWDVFSWLWGSPCVRGCPVQLAPASGLVGAASWARCGLHCPPLSLSWPGLACALRAPCGGSGSGTCFPSTAVNGMLALRVHVLRARPVARDVGPEGLTLVQFGSGAGLLRSPRFFPCPTGLSVGPPASGPGPPSDRRRVVSVVRGWVGVCPGWGQWPGVGGPVVRGLWPVGRFGPGRRCPLFVAVVRLIPPLPF